MWTMGETIWSILRAAAVFLLSPLSSFPTYFPTPSFSLSFSYLADTANGLMSVFALCSSVRVVYLFYICLYYYIIVFVYLLCNDVCFGRRKT